MSPVLTFWTIGHSNVDAEVLFDLLGSQGIDVLVDVRSLPYSQFAPQANREVLESISKRRGIRYCFQGTNLGGRPRNRGLFLPNGKPDYDQMQNEDNFRQGIGFLHDLAADHHVCLMCSEEDPAGCHRGLLVAKTLVEAGHRVVHIRHDGTTETQEQMMRRVTGGQLMLF
jgi:uncharacterized protein (DUF488 family)